VVCHCKLTIKLNAKVINNLCKPYCDVRQSQRIGCELIQLLLFPIRGLALATINLPTKFEVPISTHYEDTKGDTKIAKIGWFEVLRGHSRSLEIAPFAIAHTSFDYSVS